MGGSYWSDDTYKARTSARADSGKDAFDYHHVSVASGVLKVHEKMDPMNVKNRESRDSAAHPESLAIAVLMDVTGSMRELPKIMVEKLKPFMGLLVKKRYVDHPHILFGAIGDATCDRVPLQVGQFESGIEMDDDLSRLILEGGGGGHVTESYELAMYFISRHTAIDCWEKRNKKGYLFIIGDEQPYDAVDVGQVRALIGDGLQASISLAQIVEELMDRYEVFVIIPKGASNSGTGSIRDKWKKYFGQRVIDLADINTISETIASIIGVNEGVVDPDGVRKDLVDLGTDSHIANSVSRSLVPYASTRSVSKVAKTDGTLPVPASDVAIKTL